MYKKEDSELNEIIEGFQILGSESGGLVNPNELKEIMEIMNMDDKNPFIYNIIQTLCTDQEIQQKGGIEAKDFISLLNQELDDTSTNEGLHKIFSIFSNPSSNKIPMPVFSQIIGDGGDFTEEEQKIKKLIIKPEVNGKELNFSEFQDIVKAEIPRPLPHENIVYVKKPSSTIKKYIYNEDNNNDNKINDNNINKIEINFNNNITNNNSNFNSINVMESLDLSEKNSEKYSNGNKIQNMNRDNNSNNEKKFSYRKPKLEKQYSNDKNINSHNNNIDNNNADIDTFDNIKAKKDETELSLAKKKYRHMRKDQNKDFQNEKFEDDNYNDDNPKEMNFNNQNKRTRRQIENDDEDNNKYNKNDDNEEKSDIKTERRYHRRYRDVKSSTPDKKEEKNISIKENNKGNINSKYRRKK